MACAALLGGCSALPAKQAGPPPPAPQLALDNWPYAQHWSGIRFNGDELGYSSLTVGAADAPQQFDIRGTTQLHFRFMGVDKKISMQTADRVGHDLRLQRFSYAYDIDDNRMQIEGRIEAGRLHVQIGTARNQHSETLALDGPLYPTSAVHLYPALHGLEIGRHYRYRVYDGEAQRISEVEQQVLAYEYNPLFRGPAFLIKTTLNGSEVSSWINARGEPLAESSMGGVFVATALTEQAARRYLFTAAMNEHETLLEFSLVPTNLILIAPRSVVSLKVALDGMEHYQPLPSDRVQRCLREDRTILCEVGTAAPGRREPGQPDPAELQRHLQASIAVPSTHPTISETARQIAGYTTVPGKQIEALVAWIERNVRREAVDVFSALDVLETGRAECQGHSYLYAALARSLGIPTRVVNGLVYAEGHRGFLYHTWVESWTGTEWQAIDPTFAQVRADATHIKLIEGDNNAELTPLMQHVGRIKARILAVNTHHSAN